MCVHGGRGCLCDVVGMKGVLYVFQGRDRGEAALCLPTLVSGEWSWSVSGLTSHRVVVVSQWPDLTTESPTTPYPSPSSSIHPPLTYLPPSLSPLPPLATSPPHTHAHSPQVMPAAAGKLTLPPPHPHPPQVMAAAAEKLTPVVMELGGKDAFIVCDDADIRPVCVCCVCVCVRVGGPNCDDAGTGRWVEGGA